MINALSQHVVKFWYKPKPFWLNCLSPLSWIYRMFFYLKKQIDLTRVHHFEIPVIIVGNITVGGSGKTPFVVWLANELMAQHYHVGVISHGYKSKLPKNQVKIVTEISKALEVGDETILLRRKIQSPIVVGRSRVKAINTLLQAFPKTNLILCDDGLQHYKLGRHIEIALMDTRGIGNGLCLPLGPLREPFKRLKTVDFVVHHQNENQWCMKSELATKVHALDNAKTSALSTFKNKKVHAIAAIGNPQRFFAMLQSHHIEVIEHAFSDHHPFSSNDFHFNDDLPILMTEKDAVKCQTFHLKNAWYVPLTVTLNENFLETLLNKIQNG